MTQESQKRREEAKAFASAELKLGKDVNEGDEESLLSLFSAAQRFKPIRVLADAEEGTAIKITLEGLGELDLKLGNDVEKGERKTIMTLFWYSERSKTLKVTKSTKAGETIPVKMWKTA